MFDKIELARQKIYAFLNCNIAVEKVLSSEYRTVKNIMREHPEKKTGSTLHNLSNWQRRYIMENVVK
jgi:hypothetical protein